VSEFPITDPCEITDVVTDVAFDALVQLMPDDDFRAGDIADRIANEVADRIQGKPPGTTTRADALAEPPARNEWSAALSDKQREQG
jgi:hypothetical protein